jgi:hypothetical protein
LDSKISSSSWNAKNNFNFSSNQGFSLPQGDLYFLKGTQVSSNPHANSHVSI